MTTPMTPRDATLGTGPRHLRVGLLLRPRSTQVVSVAVAPGVPAQPLAAGHPWLTAVSIGQEVVHLARFQDPFVQRSTRTSRGGDHHLSAHDEGLIVVSVPFGSLTDLARLRIDVLDVSGRPRAVDAEDLRAEHGSRLLTGRGIRSVGFAEIEQSRDWPRVAALVGASAPPGRFEVYVDRAGEYRWRLRAAGGSIVAVSGEGFASRAECEAEVVWVRRNAAGSPTRDPGDQNPT